MSARPQPASAVRPYDVERVRRDFPILATRVNGHPLTYLDSAASSQRPRQVLRAIEDYETHSHANVHRGVHTLSQAATGAFEGARERARRFINAASVREVIFVRGTTEGINLVAQSYARPRYHPGDEILISALEHHANIVPWQLVCEQTRCTLKVAPINTRGELDYEAFRRLLSPRTRLVAVAHISNALGTILPVAELIRDAHAQGAVVLIDGAQAAPHTRVDVQALGADFYTFSAHKMYGPTGIGVLYAREALLESMPPWQGGGDMIRTVSFERTTYNELPYRFEAGTPNISGAIGLAAAMDYLESLSLEAVAAHEARLLELATAQVGALPDIELIGTAAHKAAVLSFTMRGVHAHDLGTILDAEGVAVRTGHHCAMPVMTFFNVPATARASFGCYNTEEDVRRLVSALKRAREVFA
ncbi:MAG: cysteine desulfurase [Gammaproteobacteria bacterium]|nr:cysteine desulfurase [Gammaproteobacteria bacterium]